MRLHRSTPSITLECDVHALHLHCSISFHIIKHNRRSAVRRALLPLSPPSLLRRRLSFFCLPPARRCGCAFMESVHVGHAWLHAWRICVCISLARCCAGGGDAFCGWLCSRGAQLAAVCECVVVGSVLAAGVVASVPLHPLSSVLGHLELMGVCLALVALVGGVYAMGPGSLTAMPSGSRLRVSGWGWPTHGAQGRSS